MLLRHQPIVDKDGIIYLVDNEFLMSFNSEGKRLLKLKVGGSVGPLSFVKEGMIGYVKDDKLILLE
ncbi:MAG: hypothetical protein IPK14_03745 [Blastocatellia bacterium]|nr:hypothetical protein [Blastocatellia bacterium]